MKTLFSLAAVLLCGAAFSPELCALAQDESPPPTTFVNPLRTDFGADPWIAQRNGNYYFTATSGNEVQIARARTLAELATAPRVTVWKRPATGPNSRAIWAPEIHFLRGKWFIYYTATSQDGSDHNRRVFALEAASDDPQGAYLERGQIRVPGADFYAIDGTVFQRAGGDLFFLYSGRDGVGAAQHIFIAPMSDPLTVSGARVKLSSPTLPWEKIGWEVNEGPQILEKGGTTFVIYSAAGSTTPDYALGMLHNSTGDLLNGAAWTKSPIPVFHRYSGPDGDVYTPGHNGFFKSPDGREDWIVFHGKENTDHTWGGRLARAQKFTWNPDNTPNFGFPIPAFRPLAVPSGESGATGQKRGTGTGLRAEYFSFTGDKPTTGTPRGIENGHNIDFDARLGSPSPLVGADRFAIVWRGQIEPRFSGLYSFQTYADDGVRVTIDGERVIDAYRPGAVSATRGFKYLRANRKVDIEVEYFELDGPARCSLYWASQQQPLEVVPRDWLFAPRG
ncbi:MAG: family 43 glycosylhydrolase [Armatimonadetes bacterium]|nr:family 43 glycosylhydrolase [Armatimonadota bacterium]